MTNTELEDKMKEILEILKGNNQEMLLPFVKELHEQYGINESDTSCTIKQ
jgi:hypothetical protein